MKSPTKYEWITMRVFAIAGIIIVLIAAYFTDSELISSLEVVKLFVIYSLVQGIGLIYVVSNPEILHHKINNPVHPEYLIKGKTYWLNGETHAIFVKQDSYTGEYCFSIWGLNNPTNTVDTTKFFPGEMMGYTSLEQEIFE